MSMDEHLRSDAQLLEALLEGRATESDPAVRAVFERRPEWREVFEHAREDAGAGAPWSGEASEADRRLVAECLAQARAPAARSAPAAAPAFAPVPSVRRPWTKWLALAAATLLVAWLARLWWGGEGAPVRPPGAVLEDDDPDGFFASGIAAENYSEFKWESKDLVRSNEVFVLTVWAIAPSGERGDRLLRKETHDHFLRVADEDRANWPDRVVWRVSCVNTSGTSRGTREWFAERSQH
jgi:hypothetical protein